MTKKDFELIAATIKTAKENAASIAATCSGERAAGILGGIDFVAESFANKLSTTNPNFDRKRFLVACGAAIEDTTIRKAKR